MAKNTKLNPIRSDEALRAAQSVVAQLRTKDAEIQAIVMRLETDTTAAEFSRAVDAVLDGGDPVAAAQALDNSRALDAAKQSRAVIQGAIQRAQAKADAEHAAARTRFVNAARPAYLDITRRFANQLVALGTMQAEFLAFRDELQSCGLSDWPLTEGPFGFGPLGDPVDDGGLLARWLMAAIERGVIPESDVPTAWASEWGLLRDLAKYDPTTANIGTMTAFKKMPAEVSLPSARLGPVRRRA